MKKSVVPFKASIRGAIMLLAAFIVFSCGNKSDLTNHIPKDATSVLTIDVKSMALKSVDFKQMLTFDNLKKMVGSIGEKQDSVSAAIGDSGLDFGGKFYVFGQGLETGKYVAVIAGLSDASKFEAFVKKLDAAIVVTEESGVKVAKFSDDKGAVAWNKDQAFAVVGDEMSRERVFSFINLKKEESLAATNDSFKSSQKDGGDISVWVNFADFAKMIPQYGVSAQTMNLKDTYMTAKCDFEDGKIVADVKYTTNDENAEKSKMMKGSVNTDVVNALSGETVIGLFGFAFDMGKAYEELEKQNLVQGYDPSASQMTGMTIKQIFSIFSGDFAFGVNGIEMKDIAIPDPMTGEPIKRKQPVIDYTVVVGIADKAPLFKLLDQFSAAGMLSKKGEAYTFQDKVFMFEKGPVFIVTGSEKRMNAFKDSNGTKLSSELSGMLSSNAAAGYFNAVNIPDNIYEDDETRDNVKNSELESITFTASAFKENTSKAELVVNFRNKKENALVTIGRVAKKFKSKPKAPAMPTDEGDSTAAPNL